MLQNDFVFFSFLVTAVLGLHKKLKSFCNWHITDSSCEPTSLVLLINCRGEVNVNISCP